MTDRFEDAVRGIVREEIDAANSWAVELVRALDPLPDDANISVGWIRKFVQDFEATGQARTIPPLDRMTEEDLSALAIPARMICGVYFLFRDSRVVYVGRSTHIMQRLARHVRDPQRDFDSFAWIETGREDAGKMELYYIHRFYPEQNRTGIPFEELQGR